MAKRPHTIRAVVARAGRLNPLGWITAAVFIAAWQGLAAAGLSNVKYLPTPLGIARTAGPLFQSTRLGANLVHTLELTFLGWISASAVAVCLGAILGWSRRAWEWSMASVELLRAVPVIAFLPIAVLLFGLSSKMEYVFVLYAAFWPVLVSTTEGVRAVHPRLLDVARTLNLGRRDTIAKVVLPSAAGAIIVSLRLALTISLVVAIVAEMIGNPIGLGYQMVREELDVQPALMFGYLLVIGVVGVVINAGFRLLLQWAAPGVTAISGNRE